jgi:PAS domain S-box-containing protein
MTFNWLYLPDHWLLTWNNTASEWAFCILLASIVAFAVFQKRTAISQMSVRQWLATAGFALGAVPASILFTLSIQSSSPIQTSSIPLLMMLPALGAILWVGPISGLTVSLVTGVVLAIAVSGRPSQALEVATATILLVNLLSQRYQGKIGRLFRQPTVATLFTAFILLWPLTLAGEITANPLPLLSSLDVTSARMWGTLLGLVGMAVCSAALPQFILLFDKTREHEATEAPPWEIHLSQRLFYLFVPLMIGVIVILVGIVAATSYQVAATLVTAQLRKDASNLGNSIPFYVQVGRSLIRTTAENSQLVSGSVAEQRNVLEDSFQSTPFFEQVVLLDQSQTVRATYPADLTEWTPSQEEQNRISLALVNGAPGEIISFADNLSVMTFIVSVQDPATNTFTGVLVGRSTLTRNPTLGPALSALQNTEPDGSQGLLIDNLGRVLIAPSNPSLVGKLFDSGSTSLASAPSANGSTALRQHLADGTSTLMVIQPVSGQSDWSVVFVVPNTVAIALAVQIAFPLLVILTLIGIALIPLIIATSRRLTIPLDMLLHSSEEIAQGSLDRTISVNGVDEIGRLSASFEQMRTSLKGRLDEQEFLLRISRGVSGNLELFRALPAILSSVLDAGKANAVRIVLRKSSDAAFETYVAGDVSGLAMLDNPLVDLVEKQGTVVISQIARAVAFDTHGLPNTVKALVALPLRSETSFHGILWATYPSEHDFEQSKLNFLSTVASQAAIAVANARLLAEAQEGRRKLEAVLESTPDGMIAVDQQGKITLMNPTAEAFFGIRFEQARGKSANQVIDIPDLARLLTDLREPVAAMEILGKNSKVLLANTSTILGHDGVISGRVAVLRDITALKELDNIKTVFLRMVSHDLRSPLTYMRGYLSMLPLNGQLNERQMDALDKINTGIDHIAEMTERLLYLSRLQFGDEAELEFTLVDVSDMLHEVEDEQGGAADDKEIDLVIEADDKLPLLYVDGMLFHQAISNLISNAIKYTSEGGKVTARAFVDDGNQVTISVSDTGIGIRDEDQARLFEAFYRVPQREGESPRPRGAGLGLALVKAIVDAHNGKIRVHSQYQQGSEFQIAFPIRQPDEV